LMYDLQVVNLGWLYFGIFWSYVDCTLIGMSLAALMMGISSSQATDVLRKKITRLDTYQDFYSLGLLRHKFDVAVYAVMFIAIIRVDAFRRRFWGGLAIQTGPGYNKADRPHKQWRN